MKMDWKSIIGAIMLMASYGTNTYAQTLPTGGASPDEIVHARTLIQGQLIDPSSTQFRNITLTRIGRAAIFCGELNSKNSFGGYTGFQPFVLFAKDLTIYKGTPGTAQSFQKYVTLLCDGGPKVSVPNF